MPSNADAKSVHIPDDSDRHSDLIATAIPGRRGGRSFLFD
jgi:hypothetical protein